MRKKLLFIPVVVLILVTLACGTSSNSGEKVGEVNQNKSEPTDVSGVAEKADEPVATVAATKPSSFNVGDVVEVKDHRITLTSAAYNNGILWANYLIENIGKEEMSVSSMLSFTAKDNDGTKLDQDFMDCGSSLDGKVLAGDRLRGDICFKFATPGAVKLYYESSLFSSGAVVWALDATQLPAKISDAPLTPSGEQSIEVKTHDIGEVVELDDQNVTMNSAEIQGNILKANVTVENTGKEDFTVSSMMSFYAKNSDGVKLDQEYMDCGTSMDGDVLPGDKLRGDICWKTGGAAEMKIYYEDALFGSGAIVWSVK